MDVVYVQKQKSNEGKDEKYYTAVMCGREMTTSSAWNSVETTGRVAKKQPLCITGRQGWFCQEGKW